MHRMVSSTNLALLRVQSEGVAPASAHIVINHTDCDSVLAGAIIAGDIEPLALFGEAAICADHSGQANDIADLLQALDAKRDYALSLRSLRALLQEQPLEAQAQQALERRRLKREEAKEMVASGAFAHCEGVFYADLPVALDGELFPALLPKAQVLLLLSPHSEEGARRFVKVRLGLAAPEGFSLQSLDIWAFDPTYGGRWNAGSNKRGRLGTPLTPKAYAEKVAQAIKHWKRGL